MSVKKNFVSRLTRTRLLFPLLLIVLLLPALYWYTTRPKETAAWWNESWIYRKRIDVSNPGGSDLTDFQISFTLDTTDTSKFQGNCEDLRVTGVDGNLLPFWIEENNPGCGDANTKVWVKIPSIPSSGTYIYAYYGNPSASQSSEHDGNKVFEFFDDFESYNNTEDMINAGWIDMSINGGAMTQDPNNGVGDSKAMLLNPNGGSGWKRAAARYGSKTFNSGAVLDYFYKATNDNYYDGPQGFSDRTTTLDGSGNGAIGSNMVAFDGTSSSVNDSFRTIAAGTQTSTAANVTRTGPHNVSIHWGTTSKFYFDGNLIASNSTNIPSEPLYIFLHQFPQGTDFGVGYFDNIRVRKYASTEPTTSTQSEETGPGPIAYWKFDEGTGTTTNDSADNNHGVVTGSTWETEDKCINGKCLSFDGTIDNHVVINPMNNFPSDQLSVSMWVKSPDTTKDGSMFSYAVTSQNNEFLIFNYNNISIHINGPAVTTGVSVNDGDWHHLVVTWQSSNGAVKLYKDGVEEYSGAISVGNPIENGGAIAIGQEQDSVAGGYQANQAFMGLIDEVKLYPYIRTAEQILQDYNQYSYSIGGGTNTLSNGLVGHWKMDKASWNGTSDEVIDSSGGNHHGTSVNGTSTLVGKYGNAGSFDGIDDYLNLGSFLSNENLSQMSISVWLKLDEVCTGNAAVLSKSNYFYLHCWDNEFQFSALTGNGVSGTAGTGPYDINKWIMVTMTYDSNSNQVISYLNGEQKNTGSLDGNPIIMGTGNFLIGKRTNYIKGKVDEVRVYNRTLSASEVTSLYHYAPGPQLYYSFDEGTGSSVNDISGNNNNGTWSGSGSHWSTGKYGGAASFNGTNDVISSSLNTNSLYDISTFELWFKPSTISKKGLISGYPSANPIANRWDIQLSRLGGNDAGWVSHQGGGYISTTTPIQTGVWHHLAIIHDYANNLTKVYLNGNLEQTGTAPYPTNTSINLLIGNGDGGYYHGLIDEVKIYNYARTEEQIRQDMAGTANPSISSSNILPQPVSHWSFDEQTGQTAYDKIGGKNGTLGANTSVGSDDPTWKTQSSCKTNGCLSFDGNDRISLGSISESSTSHTFTMWVKSSTTPSGLKYLFDIGPTRNVMAWHYSDGNLGFYDGNWRISNYPAPADGDWHHLAYVQNATTNKGLIYVDGVAVATNLTYQPVSLIGTAVIGNHYTNTGYGINAYVDELKIYNTALSIEQIKQDMNAGSTLTVGTTTSEAADLDDGEGNPPIAEWKFDEKTGNTANDTSGNNNTGTITGATWKSAKDCKQGACLSFDGSGDYVDTSNIALAGAFTIQYWYKTSDNTQTGMIIGEDSGGNSASPKIGMNLSNFFIRLVTTSDSSVALPSTNTWHHVSIVRDSNNKVDLYVNGGSPTRLFSDVAQSGTYTIDKIGVNGNDLSQAFTGLVDHIKIYDYARTPAQITYDYNRGEPIARWKMDECQGSTIHDSSDNSNHGTLTVTTTGGNTNGIGTCTTSTSAWGTGSSGKFGASLNFDGDGDEVVVPHHTTLLPSSSFSISTWVKYQTGNSGYFITKCYSACSGQAYYLRVINNTFRFRGVSSQGNWLGSFDFGSLNPNTWYHVTVTYEGSSATATGYINGELIKQQDISSDTGIYQSSGTSLYLGSRNNADFFSGQLDDVRIYNYALSAMQVKKVMNEGSALRFGD